MIGDTPSSWDANPSRMLTYTDDAGRPLYKLTSGGNIRRARKPAKSVFLRIREQVMERDGHRCVRCGSTDDLHIDHVVPYRDGGPFTFENLQMLCGPCNGRKGATR